MSRTTGVFHSDIGEQPLPRTMYMSEIHGQEQLYRLAQDYDLGDATGGDSGPSHSSISLRPHAHMTCTCMHMHMHMHMSAVLARALAAASLTRAYACRCTTLAVIGKGGNGSVSIIRRRATGEAYALKTIKNKHMADPAMMSELLHEIEVQKALDHPNICKVRVPRSCAKRTSKHRSCLKAPWRAHARTPASTRAQVFEAFEDPKHCKMYIVMELCTGGDLCGRLRQPANRLAGVGEKGVATMMEEMLSAVLYCHTHGVVHRDIKVRVGGRFCAALL